MRCSNQYKPTHSRGGITFVGTQVYAKDEAKESAAEYQAAQPFVDMTVINGEDSDIATEGPTASRGRGGKDINDAYHDRGGSTPRPTNDAVRQQRTNQSSNGLPPTRTQTHDDSPPTGKARDLLLKVTNKSYPKYLACYLGLDQYVLELLGRQCDQEVVCLLCKSNA
ncbi:unnamed protein product [Phytophthora fragariaefolia]|uniref:Unnamed protein product n=1 Tax=Phytophthora fragariaefolia TaxID=1490495 RepID=A0A9W6XQA1_9STRA|nr:unnamed protein product [Phytophthora fragariaefolia]